MSFFNSRRSDIVAANGAVASSQPLASQAGLRVLQDGGNAIDAAVCMAATQSVVEPMSTGVGGDMFALVWGSSSNKPDGINGSGRAGRGTSISEVKQQGLSSIPESGDGAAMSITVPGTVCGWETLLSKYGTMSLGELLQPAISYALEGFPVSKIVSLAWQSNEAKLMHRPSGLELLPGGRAPQFGESVRLPELGSTLREIAEGGSEAFYKGETAQRICAFVQAEGGWLTLQDMADNRTEWVEPVSVEYRGVDIWECPPNGQGITALIALNIAELWDMPRMNFLDPERWHLLIEAMRVGFADALVYVADPVFSKAPIDELLAKSYARKRKGSISSKTTSEINAGAFGNKGDTVYVTAADKYGNACSLINSLYQGFGSGLVAPNTGVALQNRGALFTLDTNHPNHLEPNKRPYHTIIPAMASVKGELWLSFGVMGGFQQPQGHLQVVSNMVDLGMRPQAALDAIRFSIDVTGGGNVRLEEDAPDDLVSGLEKRGHKVDIIRGFDRTMFGGGQVIEIDSDSGVIMAGSEPRKDGCAMGW